MDLSDDYENGDNIYSLVMVKQILHGQLDVYMDEAFTFCRIRGSGYHGKSLPARRMNVS